MYVGQDQELPQKKSLLQSRFASKFIWAAFGILFLVIFLFPSNRPDETNPDALPFDAFHPAVIAAEELASQNALHTLSADEIQRVAPYLKVRALTTAGPMTPEEMDAIVAIIKEYQPEIARAPNEATRQTIRNHRDRQIFDAHPRLDPKRGARALEGVRQTTHDALNRSPPTN